MFADCASFGERVTSLRTVLHHVGARVEVCYPDNQFTPHTVMIAWLHGARVEARYPNKQFTPHTVCYAVPSHLTSPTLTSPHLTSPHLTSPHLPSPHLPSPHLTSPHLVSHGLGLRAHGVRGAQAKGSVGAGQTEKSRPLCVASPAQRRRLGRRARRRHQVRR